jgi:C_GCAxxG_C_C family probable redox protein
MNPEEAIARAQALFLRDDNLYGCAETTFLVLKEAFGLSGAVDAAVAMALNGGVAYAGGICGAITGAALAVGLLAGQRFPQHKRAKRLARLTIARLMDEFQANFGSLNCRELIGMDIHTEQGHRDFIQSGLWRVRCMQQIEFSLQRLCLLALEENWKEKEASHE